MIANRFSILFCASAILLWATWLYGCGDKQDTFTDFSLEEYIARMDTGNSEPADSTDTSSASAVDGDVDGDADGDTDGDSDSDTDTDADTDGDTDTDTDADTDTDTDTDVDADTDADSDADADTGPQDCYYDGETFEGNATSFTKVNDGTCRLDTSGFYATVSASVYDGATACGRCLRVLNAANGHFVDAVVHARCPDGSESWCRSDSDDVSLDPAAFNALGGTEDSPLPMAWYFIPCEGSEYQNIKYRFEGGANPYWFAIQVRGHRNPLQSVEVAQEGQWIAAVRQDYNYWVIESGAGEGPFSVRVADIFGNTLTDDNIPLTVNTDLAGQGQFPACQ